MMQMFYMSATVYSIYRRCAYHFLMIISFQKDFLWLFLSIFHLSLSQVIFSKYTDLLPKEVLNEDTPELQRPDEEAVKEVCHAAVCLYVSYSQVAIRWS